MTKDIRKEILNLNDKFEKENRAISESVQKLLPISTRIKKGKQTYRIIRHGHWFNDPLEVTLRNESNGATIKLNIATHLRHGFVEILSTK